MEIQEDERHTVTDRESDMPLPWPGVRARGPKAARIKGLKSKSPKEKRQPRKAPPPRLPLASTQLRFSPPALFFLLASPQPADRSSGGAGAGITSHHRICREPLIIATGAVALSAKRV